VQNKKEELSQNSGFTPSIFDEMKKTLLQNLATALAEEELFQGTRFIKVFFKNTT